MEQNSTPTTQKETVAAKLGDVVTIDFKGMLNGVAFNGGTASNYNLQLGSKQFIPGFEDQLVGAKEGEERNVKVTFPVDYQSSELAGKEAVFLVKVHKIESVKLLSANDELLKAKIGEELQNLQQVAVEKMGQFQAQMETVEQNELVPAQKKLEKAQMLSTVAKLVGGIAAIGASIYFTGGMSWLARAAIGIASGGTGYISGVLATRNQESGALEEYRNMQQKRGMIGQQAAKDIVAFQQRAQTLQAALTDPAARPESLFTSKVVPSATTPLLSPAPR